jgi:hypothetical protein
MRKEEIKWPLLIDMIIYIENPKESTKNPVIEKMNLAWREITRSVYKSQLYSMNI